MRRRSGFLLFLILFLTSCSFGQANLGATQTNTGATQANTGATSVAAGSPAAAEPEETATITSLPTLPPTDTAIPPSPTPTIAPTPTDTPVPPDLTISQAGVFIHPAPDLYAGDLVTMQVLATVPESLSPGEVQVYLLVDEERIAMGTLNGRNLGGDAVGLFAWVWDTTGAAGEHQVSIVLDPNDTILVGDENPDNNRADLSVQIQPASALPPGSVNATWLTRETDHAVIHVVTGTAAARDLTYLQEATDLAAAQAIAQLQEEPEAKVDVYFIDRVLGQGGYASSALVVSYLDRNYSGGGLHEVLVHEIVHLLDQQFAHHRIPFLVEGVAVWATGGHYKQEDLDRRMAALREAGLYLPLAELIDDFYPAQHEVGYLQGAGFVHFLVDKYGWPAVRGFYADINSGEADQLSEIVSLGLQRHFGKSLAEIETEWLAHLDRVPFSRDDMSDLLVTIRYYDVMRRYQLQYDPTAHFLQAWLPFPQEVENRSLTADLTRHPEEEVNIALETMLAAVNSALQSGNYNKANVLLDSVERTLANDGLFLDPVASHYLDIVRKLSALGFRVQAIEVNANQAYVMARDGNSMNLLDLDLVLRNQNWVLMN